MTTLQDILHTLLAQPTGFTSYQVGLLQAKAYRLLKLNTNKFLEPFGFSHSEWAVLGLLYTAKAGASLNEIAEAMGVEAPFVTELMKNLDKLGLTERTPGTDRRIKITTLSAKGRKLVPKIEATARKEMRPLLQGANTKDLLGYIKVLRLILKNNKL